jgi:molybdate transport system substrate-binding protein
MQDDLHRVTAAIHVLSAGAIEPGLVAVAAAFQGEGGDDVRIKWATTPAIRQRVGDGHSADILIVPPALVDELATQGKVFGRERVEVGRVGIGVVVREQAPVPDISSVEAFVRYLATLEARALMAAHGIEHEQPVGPATATGCYTQKPPADSGE